MRILNPRPAEYAGQLTDALKDKGFVVAPCPMLEYQPPEDWGPVHEAVSEIQPNDWCFFVSQQAIEIVLPRLLTRTPLLEEAHFVCMGKSSEAALKAFGVRQVIRQQGELSSSETLIEGLDLAQLAKSGGRAYYFCGEVGRAVIPDALKSQGLPCKMVVCYKTRCPERAEADMEAAFSEPVDAILVTSEQILNNLYASAQQLGIELSTILHIVVSPRLQGLAAEKGAKEVVLAESAKAHDILSAIAKS